MTPEELFDRAFPILFVLVLVWFVLVILVCARLERAHPHKYESMGRPSLILRNSISGAMALLIFLVAREHKQLGDGYLSILSDFMLAVFVVYTVLFFGLIYMVFSPPT